jgi:L-ribulokinase
MKISRSEQTPALGAAIFGAITAGKNISGFSNIAEAQNKVTGIKETFEPNSYNNLVYKKLYRLYKQLHDAFGTEDFSGKMHNVMKDLLEIRDQQRKAK